MKAKTKMLVATMATCGLMGIVSCQKSHSSRAPAPESRQTTPTSPPASSEPASSPSSPAATKAKATATAAATVANKNDDRADREQDESDEENLSFSEKTKRLLEGMAQTAKEKASQAKDALESAALAPFAKTQTTFDENVLAQQFQGFLQDTRTPQEVERSAGALVAEIFNERGLAKAKIWELQNIIRQMYHQGAYTPQDAQKVQILEAGIAQVAKDYQRYDLQKDAATMGTVALALAFVGGATPMMAPQINRAKAFATRFLKASKDEIVSLSKASVRRETYTNAGKRIEGWFARYFRPLTAEETLTRNLEALGLGEKYLALIQEKILGPVTKAEVRGFRFSRTNMRRLRVAAVRYAEPEEPGLFGYLVFRQRGFNRFGLPRYSYVKTKGLEKKEMDQLLRQLYYGEDKRHFVELVSETGEDIETRVPFSNVAGKAYELGRDTSQKMVGFAKGFDAGRAARVFVLSGSLMGGGYLLAHGRGELDPNDYLLENLVESAVKSANAAHFQDLPEEKPAHQNTH